MAKKKKNENVKEKLKKTQEKPKKNQEKDKKNVIEKEETIDDILQEAEEKIVEADDDESEEEKEESVDSLKDELVGQQDKYIRLMAEFDNYKRRTSKEYERMVESANERLMLDIIDVRENFERALAMADEKHDFVSFLEGMKLIFNKLDENLTKNGLSVFAEIGEEFDPEIHNAMMKTPHVDIPEDSIVQIYEKGYKLKKHVIKHAKVIVSAGEPEVDNQGDETEEKAE